METAVELQLLPEAEHEAFQPGGRPVTTSPVGRTMTARQWRCRVCHVDCGGREVFREHRGSEQHFDALQVFVLRPDLFADRLHVA